ncbi:MAG: FAD-binding oxidoreductase [Spirochaetota bacterium]
MKINGWGKYPIIESETIAPATPQGIQHFFGNGFQGIARGLGRSYGDSSLAKQNLNLFAINQIKDFNSQTGEIHCEAGATLEQILDYSVGRGWFLPVTPGTKFVTVGGAVASDVHGKNHHKEGSFSDHIVFFHILLADGSIAKCSHTENQELFRATCGGMGLTGVILDVAFRMKPIQSAYIEETIIKAQNLLEVLQLFEDYEDTTYSVAWIDCLATGKKLGRSLLMVGEHSEKGGLINPTRRRLAVPFEMPSFLLNGLSISAFNFLYYHRIQKKKSKHHVHYEPFFYPLDGIHNWNRMYGRRGFTQYQFVVPKEAGKESMQEILQRIARSKKGSFLAVLKAFGKGNANYLSFPMQGYTLALDFKMERSLLPLLDELDRIVLQYGGRVYLTKDVRLKEETFKKSYPQWQTFTKIRQKYDPERKFRSMQSERLKL